jgi:hypothetical protein
MARAIYQHELSDPDFSWLINNFRETHPNVLVVESSCLPVILVVTEHEPRAEGQADASLPALNAPPAEVPVAEDKTSKPS